MDLDSMINCSQTHNKMLKVQIIWFILLSEIAMELYIYKFKIGERPTIFINRTREKVRQVSLKLLNLF